MSEKHDSTDVRRFQSGDGERIRELNDVAMATTPEYEPEIPDKDLRDVQTNYLDNDGEFLVGVVEGTIVGMGAYATPSEWKEEFIHVDSQTAELTRMRVDPEYHGQEVGSALYHELEQRARHDGYERLILDTGAENNVARGFYESLGFQLEQEMSLSFEGVTFELVLYQKSIGK
ncbi:GNAT family N-acetyltransferase [Haloarcula sp. CBA1130]|uniref:GNAT family N-acetyltransferase n=1 Tax=unclassified Haloarcula TaxID=2624677 RepID=UPI0012476E1D|nr:MULTISPECIES: GNAT family N-acetyltransferase [unclassified Haloarcula]KAA9396550.1 GNAT family N-acetyltransferase [Haloarcula sp. CBA1130]KAA9397591.1 GNAT family N-acetyltransferase [Haloarcula sp. CBA1129]